MGKPMAKLSEAEIHAKLPDARGWERHGELVRQEGWQAAIFGGRNRPRLLMVAHQLASGSELPSW